MAPGNYQQFLAQDFGWEDRYYLIGKSKPATDWPYVLPGTADGWGGTGPTSGIRSHQLNILFDLKPFKPTEKFHFITDILAYNGKKPPLFKVTINGKDFKFRLPANEKDKGIYGDANDLKAEAYKIDIPQGLLHQGGNTITLTILEGSWLVFDDVRLEGKAELHPLASQDLYVRNVKAANYTLSKNGNKIQPLLVDIEHLDNKPSISVKINGKTVLTSQIDTGRYVLEAPMPIAQQPKKMAWQVISAGKTIAEGTVMASDQPLKTSAGYADTKIGTAHSRWMIAPGPWMPFSMVKLSPDNQNPGWMAGYDPTIESIGTFSHIHEWTMAGLGMMPVNGEIKYQIGSQENQNDGYRSDIDKNTEEAPIGYYKVMLKKYGIKAELTSTTRFGFQRYTFPHSKAGRVMHDLNIQA